MSGDEVFKEVYGANVGDYRIVKNGLDDYKVQRFEKNPNLPIAMYSSSSIPDYLWVDRSLNGLFTSKTLEDAKTQLRVIKQFDNKEKLKDRWEVVYEEK